MVNLQRSLEDDGYGRFSPESVEGWISRAESDIEQWVSRLRTPHVGGARAYIGELFTSLHSTGRYSFSQTKEIIGSLAGSAARYRARSLNALEIACRVVHEAARNSQSLLRTASDTRQAGITPKIIRRLSIAELTGSLPSGNVGKEGLEEFGRALYSQLIAPVPEKGIAELFDLDPMSGRPSRSIVSLSEIAFDAEQARRQRKLLGEEGELEEGLRFPERKPKEMEY